MARDLDEFTEYVAARSGALLRTAVAMVRSTVGRSVSGLRATRRGRLLVLAAVVGLVSIAAWQLRGGLEDDGGVDAPVTQGLADGPGSFAWAQALPRGEDARVAYVVGHTLHAGDQTIDLGIHNYAEPKATVDGGWLASYGQIDEVGNWVGVGRGVLAPDGSFRPFVYQSERAVKLGSAASPDGQEVVYDGTVVDVATGRRVASLPDGARSVEAWTTEGIAYLDRRSQTWLWTPPSSPRPLADWVFETAAVAVRDGPDCTTIGRLEPGGGIATLGSLCNGVSSISPTGTYAVSESGQIERVENGQVLLNLDVPPAAIGPTPRTGSHCCAYHWEDADTLLLVVGDVTREDVSWLLVRCQVPTASCERASDVLPTRTLPYPAALSPGR